MSATTALRLQSSEELDSALAVIAFNLDRRKNSVKVDIGGIVIAMENNPQPGEMVEVKLMIENTTDLFYDAGTLWRISNPAQHHYVFFRPNPREKFEFSAILAAGIWQLSLWEQ